MDKMIHTALNSMHMITQNQSMNAQNLSNLNVPGYRRDLGIEFETAYLETQKGIDAKAFATRTNVGVFSSKPGHICLLYTSPSPRDGLLSRMPSSA